MPYLKLSEHQIENIKKFVVNSRPDQPIGTLVPAYLEVLEILKSPIKDEDVIIKEKKNETKSIPPKSN